MIYCKIAILLIGAKPRLFRRLTMNLNLIWTALEDSYSGFNNISFEGSMNTIAELQNPLHAAQ
jgi:hypothetical protein